MVMPGEHENCKAGVHGALGVMAAICLTYNALAYLRRKEHHLLTNTIVYGMVVALEIESVRHHLSALDAPDV